MSTVQDEVHQEHRSLLQAIKFRQHQVGVSNATLADHAGISLSTMQRHLSIAGVMTIPSFLSITKSLGTTPEQLFHEAMVLQENGMVPDK